MVHLFYNTPSMANYQNLFSTSPSPRQLLEGVRLGHGDREEGGGGEAPPRAGGAHRAPSHPPSDENRKGQSKKMFFDSNLLPRTTNVWVAFLRN